MSRKLGFVLALTLLLLVAATADAQQGTWKGRLRGIWVSPNSSSETLLNTGTEVAVDSAFTLEVDITYMFTNNLGLEVIAGTAKHDLATEGGGLGGVDVGSVWALPPTVTLQYFFGTGQVRPYIGAGINYTVFYSYDISTALRGLGVKTVDFTNSWGWAAQAGLDIMTGEKWSLNIDLKYIAMSTDASLRLQGGGTLDTIKVDIDPWVAGFGFGYTF